MLLKINSVFLQIFVVNVKWMTVINNIKQGESWKVGNELPLFDRVCKCQKWVKPQLKQIILWYFSRGVTKNSRGGKNIHPPRVSSLKKGSLRLILG